MPSTHENRKERGNQATVAWHSPGLGLDIYSSSPRLWETIYATPREEREWGRKVEIVSCRR